MTPDRLPLTPFRGLDPVGRPIAVPAALPCCGLRGAIVTHTPDPICQWCAERFWQGLIAWVRVRRQVDAAVDEGLAWDVPPRLRSLEAWNATKTAKMARKPLIFTESASNTPQGDLSGLAAVV